jgi:hypothetical protein
MKIAPLGLALSMLATAGAASAEIVLYEHDDFNGRSFRASNSASNLNENGFNDKASSARVRGGRWQLCDDAYFRGACVILNPGEYPSLRAMGMNDRVSSARELGWTPDGGGGWSGGSGNSYNNNYNNSHTNYNSNWTGGGNWGSGSRAVLFEGYNLSGQTFLVSPRGVSSLADMGFNDRASSLRVESGYWLFCSDAFFQGECRTFGPGDYPSLPPGLNNRISSGRRISNDYPYKQNPNWGN